MLLAVILYGSRARGDHRPKSDVDLLGVIENGPLRREVSAGGVSMYHYPAALLSRQATEGNLFALHLAREGIVLHDTMRIFGNIRDSFRFRQSYSAEIADASLIIRFLIDRAPLLVRKEPRKRLVWAIRTILIARAAEEQLACFSSTALASFGRMSDIKDAIDNRNLSDPTRIVKVAHRVLDRYGEMPTSDFRWPRDKVQQRIVMKDRGGIVADTLRFVQPARLIRAQMIADADRPSATVFTYPD